MFLTRLLLLRKYTNPLVETSTRSTNLREFNVENVKGTSMFKLNVLTPKRRTSPMQQLGAMKRPKIKFMEEKGLLIH